MSEIVIPIFEHEVDIPTRIGIDGKNAFELWLEIEGNENKTFQEWLDYLQQPATEAANEIGELEEQVRLAELDRIDQEIIRGNNENIRKQNEIDRGLAEGDREIVKQAMIDERLVSEELNEHPPILMDVSGRQLWHYWDLTSHSYISTGLPGAFNFVPNDLTSYQKYNVVQVNGTSYISLIDNNTSPIQEGTNWKTIAKVGRTPQFEIGEVTTTEEGTQATATITLTGYDEDQNPQYTVDYSIPRGYSGVYVGESEPTDPTVKVWVDPDGENNYPVSSVFGTSQITSSSQNLLTRSASYLNITKLFPLSSGYYTSTTARTAVPTAVRSNGLVISYQTASGWITERFEGDIINWLTESNWRTITPSKEYVDTALGLKIDKFSITSELGDSEELVMSQKAVTDEITQLAGDVIHKSIGKNKLNLESENFLEGRYLASTAGIVVNANYCVTDFIEINSGQSFIKNGYAFASVYTAYYDANFVYIPGSAFSGSNSIPYYPGAKYFRTTIYASEKNAIQIELGTEPTEFTDYTELSNKVTNDSLKDNSISTSKIQNGAVTGEKLEDDYKKLLVEKYVKQSDTATKYYDRAAGSSIVYPNNEGYAWAMAFVPDSNITINGSYLKPTKLLDEVHICLLKISPTNVITVLQEHDITKKWNDNIGDVTEFFFDDANLVAGTMYAIGQKSADLTTHIGFYAGTGSMPAGVSQIRPRIFPSNWTLASDSATVMYAVPSLFDTLKVKTSLNADSSIEGYEIAENTIGGSKFKDNSVTESKLADLSVTAEKINFGAVTEEKTNFLIPTKNLFNKDAEDVVFDFYVNWAYGTLYSNVTYNATGFIPIVPGQTYTISHQNQTAFYDLNKVYVSGFNIGTSTFVAPENCYFVRCSVRKTAWDTFQLEEGSESTGYVHYGYYLPEKYLPPTAFKTFANDIVTPKKQYLLSNYENSIYFKALVRRWRPDYEFVRIEGGEWSNMKTLARITNPTVETATVNARIYDLDFEVIASDTFAVQIGNIATDNGAVKGIYIGDSLTYNGSYILKVNALLPNISWNGMRESYAGEIFGEGRGGWRLSTYFETIHSSATDSFTPFMHPIDPYKYYGGTAFWAAVVNGGSDYGNNGFIAKATEIGFDAITGLLTTPALNDCMWNDANSRYERWDGSAWVEIATATLNFSFNFAKYRSTWLVDQPDIVTVMLGTNDFRSQASESAIDGFWTTWKSRMDTLCASVIADSPSAKIAILLPPTDCGSLDNIGNDFTVKQTAMMWYGRKKIINDFDDRESEGIYLVDVGRSVDPDYGFAEIYQTPFSDYNGTEKRYVQGNTPHPGADGYEQLGIPLAGWIQKVR